MTRETAQIALNSDAAHERLTAARYLARHASVVDLVFLREALHVEPVSYVRRALKFAIRRASDSAPLKSVATDDEYDVPSHVTKHIRGEVTEEITGLVLHEIASPVGLIAASAKREVPNYESSTTRRFVENLKRVFAAIEQLKSASAAPRPEEFDLAELLIDTVKAELGDHQVEVSLYGTKPMPIVSDPALIRLAICNGIRNSVEAVLSSKRIAPHPIVITWGETDVDYWISVLDRGPGVVGSAESAFGIGRTTKKDHRGFGLTIARQAIETLGGVCTLQPGMEGGTRFEIRWDR